MIKRTGLLLVLCLGSWTPAAAQFDPEYDYHAPTEALVLQGRQALILCNGLFVSGRSVDQVYAQELKLHLSPVLPPSMVDIDRDRKTVAVGRPGNGVPVMRAALRPGLGCVVMGPHQTFDDLDDLPALHLKPVPDDIAGRPWPDGDAVPEAPLPKYVDRSALEQAATWAFDRETYGHPSQITVSLLIVHRGQILLERYAPGFDLYTKTRTWSTAKSIASTLIGMLVDAGKLSLDDPLPVSWAPGDNGENDPRRDITLRHVLNMSSGLYPVDNRLGQVIGSWLSYAAGASSARGAVDRGLVHEPGTHWDYENYDTLLGVLAMKEAIGDDQAYLAFPHRALFRKIGMYNTVPGVDRFGDYVMSSQVYTNARDLARLGLLYLNNGVWNGERLLSEAWIEFSRTPAPATRTTGRFYGGQWWLVPDSRTDIPPDAYSTAGHRGQYTVVVPSYDLVIVRRGLDYLSGQHGFSQWDLTREVLKAFPEREWGQKPSPPPSGSR